MREKIYKSTILYSGKKLLLCSLFLPIFFSADVFAQKSKNDDKFCASLHKIINSANKSSLGDIKGNTLGADAFAAKTYLVSSKAKIYYDHAAKSNIYEEQIVKFADSVKTNSQRNAVLENQMQKLLTCLPKESWMVMREGDAENGFSYEVKNLDMRVFMNVNYRADGLILKMYKQEKSTANCLKGDCVNGFGTMQYENGDLYEGQFFNMQRIGMGKYIWAQDQTRYEGSWLSDTMSGFGTYFNAQGVQEKEAYMMQGSLIDIDTTKTDFCQYGNCQNGFGAYYYKGGHLYIGNFKNGLQNGLGLFESKDGIYYGQFFNGKYHGTGLVFMTDGSVFKANFVNGVQSGEVKSTKQGESVKEGLINDSVLVGAEYTPEGILKQIGSWQGDNFIASDKKDDKYLVEFAQSLSKLYSYRDQKYGRLRGNMRKGKKVVYYDAIFKLKDASATFVREEFEKEPYVRANLNLQPLPKKDAIDKYEWAVRNVRKSLNKTWKSDPGKVTDTEEAANRNHTFINMENTESFIDVRVVDNIVYIDIH